MRISRSWLEEFVAVPEAEDLEHVFEMAGIGVEAREGELFTLEVTSNRGDWLSATGLAREIGAMTGKNFRVPNPGSDEIENLAPCPFTVEIENPADCARYCARVIENIAVDPSPDWIQARLAECGMRAVNNVVDITNYVMLELGQPLHAFDADKVHEKIVVRRAQEGETLRTLDDVERTLSPEMLLIADARGPLAIAGVMGGLESEVTESTTRILLESAQFAPTLVRRGRRTLDMSSEASRRYERFVDPNLAARASERAVQLLIQHAGASVSTVLVDEFPAPPQTTKLTLRPARCNALLGLKIPAATQAACLQKLGIRIDAQSDETIDVSVPSFRSDITREVDLIEEVARINGYSAIPTSLPRGVNPTAGRSLSQRLEERAKSAFLRCGVHEIITYSLENEAVAARAGLSNRDAVRLRNPLSDDLTQMRTSLRPSLLAVLEKNNRWGARVFELGKAYFSQGESVQPRESRHLAIALMDAPQSKSSKTTPLDFFALKAILETALAEIGTPPLSWQNAAPEGFHPGRAADLLIDGQWLGMMGEVHPDVAAAFNLTARAYMAEIDFDALARHLTIARSYQPLPRFPFADRDLALVLDKELQASHVESVVRGGAGPFAREVRTFDVYTGPPIPEGKKSIALSLRFRADDRTLTDVEIDAALQAAREAAETQLGASRR
ncbi:MAG TPA: phenylalanine--tRNA ligase subunit beta [Abditibacteriaceae bacterium]|jgi:phenylalanyl-tRNA synthetase beta chain